MKRLTIVSLVAAIALPFAALADLNSTAVLSVGGTLSLATGTIGTSGGDIQFTGTTLTFQGSAEGANLGSLGSSGFNAITPDGVQDTAPLESTSAIPSTDLVAGDVFAVETNGGNGAKVLIIAVSSSSMSLQYTTYGAAASSGGGSTVGPTITSVVNNYSFIPDGFVNSGVAPGTIIAIFGTGMSAPATGTVMLQSSAGGGIPKMLGGTALSVSVGATTVTPAMYYATPSQIAAVLPSSTPTGPATLTVTYNGMTSARFVFYVVPYAVGFDTFYGAGSGLLTATNSTTGAVFNYTNSVSPGETIVLWGSGLGADTADSDTVFTDTPHAVNTALQIYIGGVQAEVLYAGSSGYPGLNQFDVVVPADAPTGCWESVVATAGTGANAVSSNFGFLPVNQGGGECIDSAFGVTGSIIGTLSGQGTVKSGEILIGQLTLTVNGAQQTTNVASADFASVSGASYGSFSGSISIGGCMVTEVINSTLAGVPAAHGLDAGTVNLMGPAGNYQLTSSEKGFNQATLPSSAITSSGGAFVFSNGSGGADVGGFTLTVNFPNPLLDWTNQSAAATVNRAEGLQVNWSGGAPGSIVSISGASLNLITGVQGIFTCLANQSSFGFLVPAYVTSILPAGRGDLTIENITDYVNFTAAGIDYGTASGVTLTSITSTYQ